MLFVVSSCLRLEKKARLSGYLLTTLHPLWKLVVFLSSSWCLANGYFERPSLEKHAKRLKTFTQLKEDKKLNIQVMQSYPARALDKRLQVDWARDPREGPRVLMSLRVDFEPMG